MQGYHAAVDSEAVNRGGLRSHAEQRNRNAEIGEEERNEE